MTSNPLGYLRPIQQNPPWNECQSLMGLQVVRVEELQSLPITLPTRKGGRCDKAMVGSPRRGMMSCPGSATNLKASDSTLPSCTAPDTKSSYRTKGSPGITLGEDQFLVCRSTITDRTLLESIGGASKTQTLARSRGKKGSLRCVASLAALDLLERKKET